jgi:hypothetical protein
MKKYAIYALSEILLVVIGILVALQLDNWNRERIEKQEESRLVNLLYDELIRNDRYLGGITSLYDELSRTNGERLLSHMGSTTMSMSIDSFSHDLMELFYIGGLTLYSTKFEQVVNGQGLDLIRSDSLQLMLLRYRNQLDLAEHHDSQMRDDVDLKEYRNRNLDAYTIVQRSGHGWFDLFRESGSSPFKLDVVHLQNDREFQNIIVNRLMLLTSARKRLERVQRHIRIMTDFMERNYQIH